eukprot:CAMPEP_0202893916 /NCGR_PEP_ID=MMETSP1392-20130828/3394_1 /ASSEMBLY_ACC=CAM_ASM_000868 /TAXON_ID=225041 /ORGANISM="Chlamydomonas chlamydogama, Strain SAG 11-48b" /LENGTH=355 /DNA_ID=CAMNT_0049578421 /DNA_START=612 /DNA_END=1679 /DNA_ORIENTATION=-
MSSLQQGHKLLLCQEMRLVEGSSLADRLEAMQQSGATFSTSAMISFLLQATVLLDELHTAGIIHRDLKPENMLLDEHDNLHIIDWGAAGEWGQGVSKQAFFRPGCGTLQYMPLERLMNDFSAPAPSDDWYGIGVVLYQMMCGAGSFPYLCEGDLMKADRRDFQQMVAQATAAAPRVVWPDSSMQYAPEWLALVEGLVHRKPQMRAGVMEVLDSAALSQQHLAIALADNEQRLHDIKHVIALHQARARQRDPSAVYEVESSLSDMMSMLGGAPEVLGGSSEGEASSSSGGGSCVSLTLMKLMQSRAKVEAGLPPLPHPPVRRHHGTLGGSCASTTTCSSVARSISIDTSSSLQLQM